MRVAAASMFLALVTASGVAGCAPRSGSAVAVEPVLAVETTPAVPATPSTTAAPTKPAAVDSTPVAPAAPSADILGCDTDTDCAVKDVGSCCGARPACVHKDAKTFPDEVQARCAHEGRMSICGFTAIEGCQCVSGRCAPIVAAPAPAAPQPVQ